MTVDTYLHRGKQLLGRCIMNGRIRGLARALGCGAAGFFLSALGLVHRVMPFSMALTLTMTGWRAVVMGLSSALGYLIFWGRSGIRGAVWAVSAALAALLTGKTAFFRASPLVMPAFGAFWVAATGLIFQLTGHPVPAWLYLLRVGLAGGGTWLFGCLFGDPRVFRRGETGMLQVRLELMAQTLDQTRRILLETTDVPIDEEAILVRTRERACGTCPNRRGCHMSGVIPRELLRKPLTENGSLPFFCRKPGRMVLELRRSQEQYRFLKAQRERRREYRAAVRQQYLFLSEYLREQADGLPCYTRRSLPRFTPEVALRTRSRETENGDRFRQFSGPDETFFLLLCDGMGTGMGAAEEGRTAGEFLQGMLTAGFPAEHALESLNSLLILRERAGAVTVDLVKIYLDTGMAELYKWGAAPSLLLRGDTTEKIGTAEPPPGIRGQDVRQRRQRLSLRWGEWLILLSDGVDPEGVRRRAVTMAAAPAGELAARLLEAGAEETEDDATVAVVRLHRGGR